VTWKKIEKVDLASIGRIESHGLFCFREYHFVKNMSQLTPSATPLLYEVE